MRRLRRYPVRIEAPPATAPQLMVDLARLNQRLAGVHAAIAVTAVLLIVAPGVAGILRHLP